VLVMFSHRYDQHGGGATGSIPQIAVLVQEARQLAKYL